MCEFRLILENAMVRYRQWPVREEHLLIVHTLFAFANLKARKVTAVWIEGQDAIF